MNLYKLSQDINNNYNTYDSCVVAAPDEETARFIHPSEFVTHHREGTWYGTYDDNEHTRKKGCNGREYETQSNTWVGGGQLDKIRIECIGKADESLATGVICASFNAG